MALTGISALAVYKGLDRLEPIRKELVARDPSFKNDIANFKTRVKEVEDVDDLLDDYRLLSTVLEAYGLESEINKRGFIKEILISDPTDPESLVNRANDNRYRDLAVDLRAYAGVNTLKSSDFAAKVESRLTQIRFEKSLDAESPGIRQAIRFQQEAANIKSPFDILGNPILRDVALGATGLPLEIVYQTVEAQGRTLEKRLDFEKFQDPKYVDRVIQQYLISVDTAATANSATAGIVSLFTPAASGINLLI
ncbi:MAG TPA: hypothetical protein DIT40_00540 [Alphaproteobacteria bacterium]|nr:hypothetical protein [Alphaproteobacteria bacterium]HCO89441.1 hypothetical protein [Alphaproteobacteria bacterium]